MQRSTNEYLYKGDMMKVLGFALAVLAVGLVMAGPTMAEESWEEFLQMKRRAEEPPPWMKVDEPRVLTREIIDRALHSAGQEINLGPYVYFEYGVPVIRRRSYRNLDTLARYLKDNPVEVWVDGHCCSIGSDRNNCRLSWARAREVVYELESRGISRDSMRPRGYGERCPLYQNNSEENRRMNRRVVLVLKDARPNPCQEEEQCRRRGRYRDYREDRYQSSDDRYQSNDDLDRSRRDRRYDDRERR